MKVRLVKPVKHDLNSCSSVFTPVSPISKTEILSSKILPDTGYYRIAEFYWISVSGSSTSLITINVRNTFYIVFTLQRAKTLYQTSVLSLIYYYSVLSPEQCLTYIFKKCFCQLLSKLTRPFVVFCSDNNINVITSNVNTE